VRIVAPSEFRQHTFRPPVLVPGVGLAGEHAGLLLTFRVDDDSIDFGIRLNDGHHFELTIENEPGHAVWPSRAEAVPIVARFERVAGGSKLIEGRRSGAALAKRFASDSLLGK